MESLVPLSRRGDFWRRVNRAAQKYDLYRIRIQDQAHWLIATVSGGAGEPTTRDWWMKANTTFPELSTIC